MFRKPGCYIFLRWAVWFQSCEHTEPCSAPGPDHTSRGQGLPCAVGTAPLRGTARVVRSNRLVSGTPATSSETVRIPEGPEV